MADGPTDSSFCIRGLTSHLGCSQTWLRTSANHGREVLGVDHGIADPQAVSNLRNRMWARRMQTIAVPHKGVFDGVGRSPVFTVPMLLKLAMG